MWLINVETRQLEEFIGHADRFPPYAILSHTWEDGQEVSFEEFKQSTQGEKRGYSKIELTCRQAALDGLDYAWVDTCCIDKSSSAELSEAINSMFNWYRRSTQCYAYLRDLYGVPQDGLLKAAITHCSWFTRGWTLQELIAPAEVKFFNAEWEFCFSKSSAPKQLSSITGVDAAVLDHSESLPTISVARKMSWAASRRTTRSEDRAYCLLGIFNINMPLLYGEEDKAFYRLQVEIINSFPDPSILAWALPSNDADIENTSGLSSGVLARSPDSFSRCGGMVNLSGRLIPDFNMSNRGIKLRARFGMHRWEGLAATGTGSGYVLPVCRLDGRILCIHTRNIGRGSFVRQDPTALVPLHDSTFFHRLMLEPSLPARLGGPRGTQPLQAMLSSRSRCLQISLAPQMDIYRRWPWQQWDEVDRVFFETDEAQTDWAALKIVAQQPRYRTYPDSESFDFLFYAFRWAKSPDLQPRCFVHKVSGQLPDRYLEDMHDRAVLENWDAYWISHRLSVANVTDDEALVGSSSNGHTTVLKFSVNLVEDQNICTNPFWRVNFRWDFVKKGLFAAW